MERFAELFADYMDDPEVFEKAHPKVAGFYAKNIAQPNYIERIKEP